jgi:prefoldin subunit 2
MSDRLESELISKITELQQEAKEHQYELHKNCFPLDRLVLDAFKKVEPTRKCFRLIGGVLVERTVQEIQPSLEENLANVRFCLHILLQPRRSTKR